MRLDLDEFAHLDSPLHRWDARYKLAGLGALLFAFSFVTDLWMLPAMIAVTAAIYRLSRLPAAFFWRRMRYPGFFATTYDWVPDVQHAGMAATTLQRMLLQEVGGKIILLPAWPENWSVDFKLHAKRQTIVEGLVKDGRIVKLTVTPEERQKEAIIAQP